MSRQRAVVDPAGRPEGETSPKGLVLGIDTSAGVSVGVVCGEGEILARRSTSETRRHVETLMPLIEESLASVEANLSDLTDIVVGMGPGPFTGLRVGVVTAATLGAALAIPVRHVCSLDILARQWILTRGETSPTPFVAALDARRHELYWARYDAEGNRIGDPAVAKPSELPDLPVLGPGAIVHPEAGGLRGGAHPDSLALVDVAVAAAHPALLPEVGREPLYLRRPDAVAATTRKSVITPGLRLAEGR
ncbi:MAG: tRNA (adenosine(37)-N6)-threonylcarbamoyltransferase complex dimerization subunit type 1 TsaB [Propionibacteriaceae bacterium]|nr:tRNA (adenosine(37)-N6)-threonylcarbamoyltransferase complex dimerization subunit type 1 TsaB [Propionibacteriaceae bacterium]